MELRHSPLRYNPRLDARVPAGSDPVVPERFLKARGHQRTSSRWNGWTTWSSTCLCLALEEVSKLTEPLLPEPALSFPVGRTRNTDS